MTRDRGRNVRSSVSAVDSKVSRSVSFLMSPKPGFPMFPSLFFISPQRVYHGGRVGSRYFLRGTGCPAPRITGMFQKRFVAPPPPPRRDEARDRVSGANAERRQRECYAMCLRWSAYRITPALPHTAAGLARRRSAGRAPWPPVFAATAREAGAFYVYWSFAVGGGRGGDFNMPVAVGRLQYFFQQTA